MNATDEMRVDLAAKYIAEAFGSKRWEGFRPFAKSILDAADAVEPIAWESTTIGYVRFVTDSRYRKFSDEAQRWYKPYRCSACADTEDYPRMPEDIISEESK